MSPSSPEAGERCAKQIGIGECRRDVDRCGGLGLGLSHGRPPCRAAELGSSPAVVVADQAQFPRGAASKSGPGVHAATVEADRFARRRCVWADDLAALAAR